MSPRSLPLLLLASCGPQPIEPVPTPTRDLDGLEIVVARPMKRARMILARDGEGIGTLLVEPIGQPAATIPCDPLPGAWGLWLDDVDGDDRAEAIVALRKRARFDRNLENRLHVYSFEDGRCVPAWRGTRLAGRFDAITVDPDRPGTLLARERVSADRNRVARYRWNGFGYAVEAVLWQGQGSPPSGLDDRLQSEGNP